MATLGLLIVFPFLMAYAAANDLLTMLIPNRISLALTAAFALLAAGSVLAALAKLATSGGPPSCCSPSTSCSTSTAR